MAIIVKPLSDPQCASAKPKDKDYPLFDGEGLILLVRTSGTKTWRYRYSLADKKTKIITLGKYPALSLAAARVKRTTFEAMRASGLDPKEQLELEAAKQENRTSLEKIARAWHAEQTRKEGWGIDTGIKTMRKLENHLFPLIGKLAIADIETLHLTNALALIDNKGVNRTARDIKANLVRIFTYAIQQGYISNNPARELDGLIIPKKKKHYPALPHARLPELLKSIEGYKRGTPITRLCILLTLHVFIRSSEVRFARWSEIDFDKCQWIIPASRVAVKGVRYSDRGAKMKENHLVPLSPQAMQILKDIHQYSGQHENLFPNRDNPTKFISENTVNEALRHMGYDTTTEICGHGFRTMACGALIQSRLYSEDAVERQMSHKERNEVRGSYTHMAEFLEERKSMMYWWSDYIELNYQQHLTPYDFGKVTKQNNKDDSIIQFRHA